MAKCDVGQLPTQNWVEQIVQDRYPGAQITRYFHIFNCRIHQRVHV